MNNLLNEYQAADLLNVSRSSMAQWRMKGIGPAFLKLNKAVRYRLDELEAWINARQRQNTINLKGRTPKTQRE